MAISFPSNPSNGDKFESNSMLYQYDGTNSLWIRLNRKDVSHYTDTTNLLPAQTLQVVNVPDLASLPGSASAGQMMYVLSENKLYLWTGSTWQTMTLAKQNPVLTSTTDGSGGTSPFTLATDGSTTVITMTASHPDSLPLIYNYNVVAGSLTNGGGTTATITQGTGAQSNQFFIQPSTDAAYNGSFTLEFTVSDGEATEVSVGEFTLSISPPEMTTDNFSYDSVDFDVSTLNPDPRSFYIAPDGLKFYIMQGNPSNRLRRYNMSTAWDLSTASSTTEYEELGQEDTYALDARWSDDGTKLWMLGAGANQTSTTTSTDTLYYYTNTSSAFTLFPGSLSFMNTVGSITFGTVPMSFRWRPDGLKLYTVGRIGDAVKQYTASTAFDITTISYDSISVSTASYDTEPQAVTFSSDGTKMFVLGGTTAKVYEYTLGIAWDLGTAVYDNKTFSIAEDSTPRGFELSADDSKLYVVGDTNNKVYQYSTGYTSGSGPASGGSSGPTALTPTVVENDGSITAAAAYAGGTGYYANSRPAGAEATRLRYSIQAGIWNNWDVAEIEFYTKILSQDNFPSLVDLIGGDTLNMRSYIRANRNGVYAAGISGTYNNDNTGWCNWSDWNKITLRIDMSQPLDNSTILVNDVVKMTGTAPQTWTGYNNSNDIHLSFFQLITEANSDNGVEAYIDELRIKGYSGGSLIQEFYQPF